MTRRWPRVLIPLLLLSCLAVPPALAGTTGKLTGKITNEKKEPMAGVNIRLDGQRLGAISDDQGGYVIIGVPAGTYVVRANLMGSAPWVGENVVVTPDFTTELNIVLKTEAVQLTEVKVEAERPLLQKDATSTARFISADQMSRMPTRGYQDAAAQQSGVVAFQRQIDRESANGPTLIIRGGRPNETAYYVDGFSQADPLTGNATTSINNNAIQEVVVLNGGFNAEYGRIMSGVVNVITKEGTSAYGGSVEALTDNFGGSNGTFLGTHSYDYNLYDASFGGPLLPGRDAGSFYLSGQRRWQGDRAPNGNFDGSLPANSLGGWTGQAKLTFPLTHSVNLKVGGLYSDDDWREYLNSYRYDLLHTPRYSDRNRSATGQLFHTLSARTFYSVGASYFYTERKRGDGLYFDDIGLYGQNGQKDFDTQIPWFWPGTSDPNSSLGHVLDSLATVGGGNGHVFDDYMRRQSQYWAIKGDLTSQATSFHQLKTGFEVDKHTLRFYEHYFPTQFPTNVKDIDGYGFSADGRTHVDSGQDGARKPFTASYYLQDKYERSGVVVNAGLRYDYINTNVDALASEKYPLGTGPSYSLEDSNLVKSKTYSRLSPRIGIGFPVSDKMVLHANWGQFFQQPNLQDLYVSYRFLEYKIINGGYYVGFGNPNLKPEQTTAYEVGIANQLSPNSELDITAYYKDVKDLVEVQNIASLPGAFTSYRNKDFATIKGIDLGYTLRRVNHIQANISYSLAYAVGTGSVSNTQRNLAWYGTAAPKQTAPLDFDQRHKISIDLDYALGRGEGPKVFGSSLFQNFDLNVLYNIGSGTPYTPSTIYDEVSLAAVASTPVGPINSQYGPWTQTLDFKAGKTFHLAATTLNAYVWVLNAFDIRNAIAVYTGTGSPSTTAYLNTSDGAASSQGLYNKYGLNADQVYSQALQNQGLLINPRMIRFGLRMGF